jgi:hypothetical protein
VTRAAVWQDQAAQSRRCPAHADCASRRICIELAADKALILLLFRILTRCSSETRKPRNLPQFPRWRRATHLRSPWS